MRLAPLSVRTLCWAAFITLAIAAPLKAADPNGGFAVKGSGAQTCETFTTAMAEGHSDISTYGGWIEGYLTGQNQRIDQTFDAAAWANTSTLLIITRSICTQMPADTRFIEAFDTVLRMLLPSRLRASSPLLAVQNGTQELELYRDVLNMVRDRLAVLKFDADTESAEPFGARTRQALKDFQTSRGLDPTGLPDQRTLVFLFLPNAQASEQAAE